MRKALILTPIFFAYLLVLGHNFIPHTHVEHDHSVATACHEYLASSDDHSRHEHDHGSTSGDQTESTPTGFAHLFMHFAYSPYTNSDISCSVVTEQKNKTVDNDAPVFITEALCFFEFPGQLPFRPPVKDDRLPSGNTSPALSLRGPPAIA